MCERVRYAGCNEEEEKKERKKNEKQEGRRHYIPFQDTLASLGMSRLILDFIASDDIKLA